MEERIARLESELMSCEYKVIELHSELCNMINELSDDLRRKISTNGSRISSLEEIVDAAITTAVHELIDYLRHDDIQALDEAEFASKVKELMVMKGMSVIEIEKMISDNERLICFVVNRYHGGNFCISVHYLMFL